MGLAGKWPGGWTAARFRAWLARQPMANGFRAYLAQQIESAGEDKPAATAAEVDAPAGLPCVADQQGNAEAAATDELFLTQAQAQAKKRARGWAQQLAADCQEAAAAARTRATAAASMGVGAASSASQGAARPQPARESAAASPPRNLAPLSPSPAQQGRQGNEPVAAQAAPGYPATPRGWTKQEWAEAVDLFREAQAAAVAATGSGQEVRRLQVSGPEFRALVGRALREQAAAEAAGSRAAEEQRRAWRRQELLRDVPSRLLTAVSVHGSIARSK